MQRTYKQFQFLVIIIVSLLTMAVAVIYMQKPQDLRKNAAPASSLYFNPSTVSVRTVQNFESTIMIDPSTNIVSAVELHIEYDPRTLRLTELVPSSAFSVLLRSATIDHTTGHASVTVGTPPLMPVRTVAPIVRLSLQSLSTYGSTMLRLASTTKAAALDETISAIASMQPSLITISTPTPTPTATPTNTPTPTPLPIPGDINRNGRVDIYDYNTLVETFGQTGAVPADINGSGKVDIFDYNILVANFGRSI